jgi:quercetin dioxygenase-like cupin family protein
MAKVPSKVLGAVAMIGALALAAPAQAKPGAVLTAAADEKWADVPGFPGVKISPVEGNPEKGPSHFLIKFAPGFAAPLHHHSSDHYVTVLAGNMTMVVDGKEVKLGPGSFFQFTGKQKHETRCDAGAECELSVDSRGKWDVVVEDAGKKPADAAKPAK